MPIIWIGFSTATSPDVDKWKADPTVLKRYVQGVVSEAGGELVELYFHVDAERACALVLDLDDYVNVKAVTRILGADEATKLVNPDQAKDGLSREQGFREAGENAATSAGS
jgi:hypothetical protein